jgi:hypothetical protein
VSLAYTNHRDRTANSTATTSMVVALMKKPVAGETEDRARVAVSS